MEVPELVRTLLQKRGIVSETDITAFLNPDYEAHTHNPMLLRGMDTALERFFSALEKGERIAIYADYDCDGVCGATVLSDFFNKIGYEQFEVYMPHRDREGYGVHVSAIDELAGHGVNLVITVDVGISAREAVAFAREKGIDVIITDHHEIMGALPEALAVINPKIESYPFPHLCGAAVAFQFVRAALSEGRRRELPAFKAIPEGWEKWLLDVVAIATIADMVPLVGENRVLAKWGLEVVRKSPRPGIAALCDSARLRQYELTEDDIGFSIAPRLNAASRMGEPDLALKLLTTRDPLEARSLARMLESLNTKRKGIVAGIVKQAKLRANERFPNGERVVVLGDTAWKPALLGLAANSVVAERGGVVCLWGRDASGSLKGSCRSDGSISLVELFGNAHEALEQYGGHAHSGGFTVSHERVHDLPEQLARAGESVMHAPSTNEGLPHDATVALPGISPRVLRDVSLMAPFGIGNPKPVFLVEGAHVGAVRRFGKQSDHVEVMLEGDDDAPSLRAFEFFKGPEQFTCTPRSGTRALFLGTLQRDSFRGGALCMRLVDVLPA